MQCKRILSWKYVPPAARNGKPVFLIAVGNLLLCNPSKQAKATPTVLPKSSWKQMVKKN
jgi:hypothetical protein